MKVFVILTEYLRHPPVFQSKFGHPVYSTVVAVGKRGEKKNLRQDNYSDSPVAVISRLIRAEKI